MSADDELERELKSFQPRPASPELRRRVGWRLIGRRRLKIALAAAIAAALFPLLLHYRPLPSPPPDGGIVPPIASIETPSPTLLAYQRAAARSPESLDELLDRQAVRSGWSDPAGWTNSNFATLRGIRP